VPNTCEVAAENFTTSLIVNADDFGYSRGVNRGIVEAHEDGIVTSASLMVKQPAAVEAARYAQAHPELDVGLHVELRRWSTPRLRRWPEGKLQAVVERDIAAQFAEFRRLLDRDPTHLDSHHHRHRIDSLRPLFQSLAQELNVPLRHFASDVTFCGEFYGHDGRGQPDPDAITPTALVGVLESLRPGVTELGCHPGYTDGLRSWYREERVQEVRTLCDSRVRLAIDRFGIKLVSFRSVDAHAAPVVDG
jgi:predicted glycoside hydrolase/deacetylase ChbG (UPF0249 family)